MAETNDSDVAAEQARLRSLLQRPFETPEDHPLATLDDDLQRLWRELCESHQVDLEAHFVPTPDTGGHDHVAAMAVLDELRRAHSNASSWIKAARTDFNSRIRALESRMATRDEYAKHFAEGTPTLKELHARTTRTDVSLLYRGAEEILDRVLVAVFERFFTELTASGVQANKLVVGMDVCTGVGSVRGSETRYLAIEVNRASRVAHAYPISDDEFNSMGENSQCYRDDWQGFDLAKAHRH